MNIHYTINRWRGPIWAYTAIVDGSTMTGQVGATNQASAESKMRGHIRRRHVRQNWQDGVHWHRMR